MEFQEILRRRRMVRNYLPDPVDTEALERVVQAARRAPSAGFSQGTGFVIVTEPDLRTAIAASCHEPEYVAAGFDPWVSRAPAHIVLCVSEDAYHRRYREPDKVDEHGNEIDWPVPFWWVDAGAALMLVLLAAVDEGLAAGFLGANAKDLRTILKLPGEMIPVGIVTMGYPAPDRRSGSLKRGWRPDDQVIHWQTWTTGPRI
jgi:5,6-dimethylbenzimidazole synthase